MKISKFALGVRFAAMAEQPPKEFARKIYEGIFSVLTLSELEELMLYGGPDPFSEFGGVDEEGDIYLVVLMGGKLKQMRKVYHAIAGDAALDMYLVHNRPFVENNRLFDIGELDYFGQIKSNGKVEGGDGTLDGLSVPKKRGRRKPVGKGIRVLLAPEDYQSMSSTEAIKRITVAARRHFQGVKLTPFPLNMGKGGFAASVVTAFNGAMRKTSITSQDGSCKKEAHYGVLRGKTAVIETACAFDADIVKQTGQNEPATSSGVGELLRRALDEGLKSIVIDVHDHNMGDGGMGFARALGIRFFDENGSELECASDKLGLIARADTELMHLRLGEARILCMDASENGEPVANADKLTDAVSKAIGKDIDKDRGFAGLLCAICSGEYSRDYDDLLKMINFTRLIKNTALVVTGCQRLDKAEMTTGAPMYSIIKRCAEARLPIAMIVDEMADGADTLYSITNAGIMSIGWQAGESREEAARKFDSAAERMFRFIRMGRDVEKIGAPKQPKVKPWFALLIDSWKNGR